jgi:hypothetical protein
MTEHADLLLNLSKLIERINNLPVSEPKAGVKLTKFGVPDKRMSNLLSDERKVKLRSNAKAARDAARDIWMKRDGPVEDEASEECEYEFRKKEPKVEKAVEMTPIPVEAKPEKPKKKRYVKRAVVVDVTDNDTSDADFYKPEPPKATISNMMGKGIPTVAYNQRNAIRTKIIGKYVG